MKTVFAKTMFAAYLQDQDGGRLFLCEEFGEFVFQLQRHHERPKNVCYFRSADAASEALEKNRTMTPFHECSIPVVVAVDLDTNTYVLARGGSHNVG